MTQQMTQQISECTIQQEIKSGVINGLIYTKQMNGSSEVYLHSDEYELDWNLKIPIQFAGLLTILLDAKSNAFFFGQVNYEEWSMDVENIYPCFLGNNPSWFDSHMEQLTYEYQTT